MKKETNSTTTRQAIVLAASQIVLEHGVAHLTLEAVARRAGVSKGGLLYHFPGKEELIQGLVESLNQQFDREVERQIAGEKEADAAGAWLRAYVRATFHSSMAGPEWLATGAALLAAVATNPQLLEPFRRSFAGYQQQTENDRVDPALATIVRLAADGLWLADLFGLAPPADDLRRQVEARLLELTRQVNELGLSSASRCEAGEREVRSGDTPEDPGREFPAPHSESPMNNTEVRKWPGCF